MPHNPEVEGSNPSPATKLKATFWTIMAKLYFYARQAFRQYFTLEKACKCL